jgi:hypothetical protein
MTHRLLRLSLPLALLLAVPAAQMILERAVLASTEQSPAALSSHAVLIGVATILFLFLNGPNDYAVLAIARLEWEKPAEATSFAQNTIVSASYSILLCVLLIPAASGLTTPLLSHKPTEDEVDCARTLFITETCASWFLLFGYDLLLSLFLRRILARSVPAQSSRGE